MPRLKPEYIEKIYSGWLAKIIGIRLGAPIEGWTYDKIKDTYGEVNGYVQDFPKNFAADDDSNGPLFFLRALEDSRAAYVCQNTVAQHRAHYDLSPQDIANALLNYAPYEHGFFWWGGYGVSTEHTAYLNLRSGIPAPRSGSIQQNGTTVAEQIGGQIFIDTWGLVTPGNPDQAAIYAEKAASVTHDGNGIYGGIFIAVCISHAFEETNIRAIIEKGLSYIPADCEYTKVVRAVMDFHEKQPENWHDCYRYIFENFGYDRYPGNCHIIPNSAVMVLSLLYGEGDFADTINICNMCGWDTDCNVGNVATIMGVLCGLDAIDYKKWRLPINDLLICSSVVGSLNIMDIPYGASYIAKLAWDIAGEALPAPWDEIISQRIDSCHFEYPGSTHAVRVRVDGGVTPCTDAYDCTTQDTSTGNHTGEAFLSGNCTTPPVAQPEYELHNTAEAAYSGTRSLKTTVKHIPADGRAYVYKQTYYKPADFHDSRYDPCFSPLVYPGQTIHCSVMLPEYANDCAARLYVHDAITGSIIQGPPVAVKKGQWEKLSFAIPRLEAALVDEAGLIFEMCSRQGALAISDNHTTEDGASNTHFQQCCRAQLDCYIDDLYFSGSPDYTIDFSKCEEEVWNYHHKEVSQFTRLKGLLYLCDNNLHLSCADFGEAYTGHHNWTDYTAQFHITPITGKRHMVNVRVQGAMRSYGAGFYENGKLGLFKNEQETPKHFENEQNKRDVNAYENDKSKHDANAWAARNEFGYRKLIEADFPWESGTEYLIAVAVKGPELTVSVDGSELIRFTDTHAPYLTGAIGITVQDGSHMMLSGINVH